MQGSKTLKWRIYNKQLRSSLSFVDQNADSKQVPNFRSAMSNGWHWGRPFSWETEDWQFDKTLEGEKGTQINHSFHLLLISGISLKKKLLITILVSDKPDSQRQDFLSGYFGKLFSFWGGEINSFLESSRFIWPHASSANTSRKQKTLARVFVQR